MVSSLVGEVDKVINMIPSSIYPTLPLESENQEFDPFPPVDPILPLENATQVADLVSSSVYPTLHLEIKLDTCHIFLFDIESTVLGGIRPSPVQPPPSNVAILFYWDVLNGPHIPSHVPSNITVQCFDGDVHQKMIDEGASVSILSSIAWKVVGCPHLVPVTQNLLSFNRRANHPLGILLEFIITLGGKIVVIDVMVVHDPLDFDLILGRDYVYSMKDIVSTLFRMISFPHDGGFVTIYQLSFVGPDLIINPMTSPNGSYMHMVSPPPYVNYVTFSPMPSVGDADEPLTVISISYDLDPVVNDVYPLSL
jgi:hypothetical protein